MIVEIEYPITASGRPNRASKEKTVVFTDTVRFDFPEYGRAESPVALVSGDTPYYGIDGALYLDTGLEISDEGAFPFVIGLVPKANVLVRHLEKRLVDLGHTLRNMHSTAVATALHPLVLADHFAKGLTTNRTSVRVPLVDLVIPPLEATSVKDLDEVEVERQKRDFIGHLSDFVVREGRLLRKSPEPVYAVKIGYAAYRNDLNESEGSPPEIHVVVPPRDRPLHGQIEYVNCVAFFTADRYDDAVAYAREIKPAQGEGPREPTPPGRRVEVRDTGCISFDDERESLLIMAEHMARGFIKETVGHRDSVPVTQVRSGFEAAPLDALIAWKQLSAAMKSDDHEQLPIAMRECLDFDEGREKPLFAVFPMPIAVIETAIRKWDNREVSLSFSDAVIRGPRV